MTIAATLEVTCGHWMVQANCKCAHRKHMRCTQRHTCIPCKGQAFGDAGKSEQSSLAGAAMLLLVSATSFASLQSKCNKMPLSDVNGTTEVSTN